MVRRRHAVFRLNLERLETRRLLAIERPFVEHVWEATLGDVGGITAVADLDGDGRDDVVARGSAVSAEWAASPNNAWYKLNSETNQFQVAGVLPSRNSDRQYFPTAAVDFDSDGDFDLLMTIHDKPGVDEFTHYAWIENLDGRGTFGRTFHRIAGEDISTALYIADLDFDGDWDAAYQGMDWDGSSFRRGWAENVGGEFTFHRISIDDLEDDSYLYDVDGDGQRRSPEVIASTVGRRTFDLDSDGDFDWLYRSGRKIVWEENVDGRAMFESRTLFDSNVSLGSLRVADVDQDQDLDIWVQTARNTVLLGNDGTGQFTTRSADFIVPGMMVLADLEGDGLASLAGIDTTADELVWYDYDPITSQHVRHAAAIPQREIAQALADMDGDGSPDLVGLRAWYEPSDSLSSFIRHEYDLGRTLDAATPMDVDGNGQMDLVIAWNTNTWFQPSSRLSWLQRSGNETVEHPIASNLDMSFAELRALDLDLDGDLDLLALESDAPQWWEPASGSLEWWENTDGQGAFAHRGAYVDGSLTSVWHVADIDGDGDLDLITIRDESIAWRENVNRGESYRPAIEIARLPSIREVHAADLNGDGDLDLVVSQDETLANPDWMYLRPHPRVTYSFLDNQDGRGDFARVDNTLEDRGILALVGDMNGDGAAELVESPREIEGIIIHENVTPTEAVPGDINQDGSADAVDADQFCVALSNGEVDSRLDVSSDGQVTLADFEYLVEQLAALKYGDASLDGDFDSSDLVRVLQRGHYEDGVPANSGWQDGDWNCDREFSTADLVWALQHGDYGQVVQDRFLLVAHRETNQVLSFDAATGEFVAEFAKLERPLEIEVGPDGDVYVVQQTGPPRISRYRANGELVTSIVIPGRADAPRVAFGPDGDLYAAYFFSRRIERFRVDGDAIVSQGDIVGPGVIGSVNGFDVGPDGDLYVAVGQTESIWRFSGTTGERLDDFAATPRPEGMAFGPDGDLYVGSDMFSSDQVRRYNGTNGELVGVLIDEIPSIYGRIDPVFTDNGYLLLAIALHGGMKVYRYDALTGDWIDVLVGEGEVGLEHPVDIALLRI